jgi:hypothetical protein
MRILHQFYIIKNSCKHLSLTVLSFWDKTRGAEDSLIKPEQLDITVEATSVAALTR